MSSNDIYPYHLISLLEKGEKVDIIDLRSTTRYNLSHISNAIHIPTKTKKDIIALCETMHQFSSPVLYCDNGIQSKRIADSIKADDIDCRILLGGFNEFYKAAKFKVGLVSSPYSLQPLNTPVKDSSVSKHTVKKEKTLSKA